jgi:hypothetical protein
MLIPDTFLITDGSGELARIHGIISAALDGGVRGIQVREPSLSARQLCALCADLKPRIDACGGVLVVNDRADVVAAGLAHGVQLGHRSLRPEAARRFLPRSAIIGCSVHDLSQIPPPRLRPKRYSWAELMQRAFAVDVLQCPCGARRRVLKWYENGGNRLEPLHRPEAGRPKLGLQRRLYGGR